MTKIVGEIAPDDINRMEEELREIATTAKSGHFHQGEIFGHLPMVIKEAKMRQILVDPTYVYAEQADPGAYDPAAVAAGINAAQQAQMEGEHRKNQETYEEGIGVVEGLKTLIVYTAGQETLDPLEERYIGFANSSPHEMIKFLHDTAAVQMTALDKDNFKRQGFSKKWDTTKHLSYYIKYISDFVEKLETRDINTSNEGKLVVAVARMYESEYFSKKDLMDWEEKPVSDQDWTQFKMYFGDIYQDKKRYAKSMNKRT